MQRRQLLKAAVSSPKVDIGHADSFDFVALNISRIKTKPKEKVMKIYATQKLKETDVQKMKDREEQDMKKEVKDTKAADLVKPQSTADTIAEKSEPEPGFIEALF